MTESEINFYKHYNWECLNLAAGPALQWLKDHEIPIGEFTRLYHHLQRTGIHSFLFQEPVIEPPMEYPWKDANAFWKRHEEELRDKS